MSFDSENSVSESVKPIYQLSDVSYCPGFFDSCSGNRNFHSRASQILPVVLPFAPSPNLPAYLRALLLLVLVTTEDVTEYLFWAKEQEQDKWLQDDIAIAIRTCVLAAEGCQNPNVTATYEVLGVHPDHLQQLIEDRRRALLGDLYEAWYGVGAATSNSSDPLPPRKAPQAEMGKKAAA